MYYNEIKYWKNGNKKREISYKNDLRNGLSIFYDRNGNVVFTKEYKRDKMHGLMLLYNKNKENSNKYVYFLNYCLDSAKLSAYRDCDFTTLSDKEFLNVLLDIIPAGLFVKYAKENDYILRYNYFNDSFVLKKEIDFEYLNISKVKNGYIKFFNFFRSRKNTGNIVVEKNIYVRSNNHQNINFLDITDFSKNILEYKQDLNNFIRLFFS